MTKTLKTTTQALLDWYDQNARDLAWRIMPHKRALGILPDPYRVWLSEIMLQQTTVVVVDRYFNNFIRRWAKVQHLAVADDDAVMAAWAGLGYYARARNLLKTARIINYRYDGNFPSSVKELQKLPGIGTYTAAAINAIAFDQPATVVDSNVTRVIARYFAVKKVLPTAK